ncbi:hypothetical protein JOE33_004020 [Pseudomonas sp. PvP027]|nr:hypothetical protein [Pseudomonas sp. PvP027]
MKVSSGFSNREGGRVKPHGLDWLRGYAQEINLKVAETKGAKVRAKSKDKIDQWGADHQVTLRSNLMDTLQACYWVCVAVQVAYWLIVNFSSAHRCWGLHESL